MGATGWEFWIDRGGTFTDIVAQAPDGGTRVLKLLSEHKGAYRDAAVEGIRRLMNIPAGAPLPEGEIARVRMGTTVATNALLERAGAPTVLLTTIGHRDALFIGTQNRPKLFALKIERPSPLYGLVLEADERITVEGTVLRPLDEERLRHDLEAARGQGFEAIAIAFLHAWRFPGHELKAAELARAAGFSQVTLSHVASPLMRFVPRADTAVADAYLTPALRHYVALVAEGLGPSTAERLDFMQSSGGLTRASLFQGKDAVLSGPAGGVVGAVKTALAEGLDKVIGFDMGGTSTDVSRFDGHYERRFEALIDGVRLRAPMLAIDTVAAGGGSILAFDQERLKVGPASAGADPGPAAYGRGGPLTVTDVNLLLGRIISGRFPKTFGPEGTAPLDEWAPRTLLATLAEAAGADDVDAFADGFLAVATDNMARAIKKISVARGYDVRDYTLVAFGGAAGQLACRVADALGMRRILMHPLASVLSAVGIGLADVTARREAAVEAPLGEEAVAAAGPVFARLEAEALAEIRSQGHAGADIIRNRTVRVRYQGTDTALEVPARDAGAIAAAFRQAHLTRFGFAGDADLVLESLAVEAVASGPQAAPQPMSAAIDKTIARHSLYTNGRWHDVGVHDWAALRAGTRLDGPALIVSDTSSLTLEPGWTLNVSPSLALIAERTGASEPATREDGRVDPVRLEIFNNLFMSIAEEMGATLEKTAASVNIKERLDFSCAIFDASGCLIANAPHMPVHLGSMGDSVRTIIEAEGARLRDGDVFALNAPYRGGTHLPDITVIAPVFIEGGLRFYVAARGHHADVGGMTPGSMPPRSTSVDEEGVLLDGLKIVSGGVFDEPCVRAALGSGRYPARNPSQNIADLKAQIAACRRGADELAHAVRHYGLATVLAYMGHVQDNAEEAVRRVIDRLAPGSFRSRMDDGAEIAVRIEIDRPSRSATIDFTGTSGERPSNFNAPYPVTRAAVLYAFRCLVDSDIPMNEGCMRPLRLIVPEGSMLRPRYPAAVVAGNVETSQALTDTILAACGALAASQGTMNNLTFGDDQRQYYETICGGAGAGPGFDGADAVHTHMTNSRLTDAEVLEWRYPVLVDEFTVRRGSGGRGRHRGGDGVVRKLTFRSPMTVGLLSTRRITRPFGLHGGEDGAAGAASLIKADGTRIALHGCDERQVSSGDSIEILTPGGGGFGAP